MPDMIDLSGAFANSEAMRSMQEAAKRIMEIYERAIPAYRASFDNFEETLSKIYLDRIPDFKSSTVNLAESFENAYSSHIKEISSLSKEILASIDTSAWARLVKSIEDARPYMTEEQEAAVDTIVEPSSERDKLQPRRLTFNQWLTLFGIIMQLIMLVISRLPNEQLEEISRQNEVIIDQQTEQTELLRRLTDAASDINDVLETFQQDPDQPEDLADLPGLPGDDAAESPDGDSEPEQLDAEDNDADALEQQDDHDR